MTTHAKSWIRGFIVGSLLGAGIALLKAPRSGEKTRTMLVEKGMNVRDKAVSTVDDTVKQVEKVTKNITNEAAERADKLKNIGQKVYEKEAAVIQDGVKEAKKVLNS